MKFNEFYNLVVENDERILEEGVFNKLKILLTMAILGLSHLSYQEMLKEYNRMKSENPEKIKRTERLAEKIESRKEEVLQNPDMLSGVVQNPSIVTDIIKNATGDINAAIRPQLIAPDKEKAAEIIKDNIKKYIRYNEISTLGIRNKSYADSKGYQTIGIGHLVLKDEIGKLFTKDEISKERDKNGVLRTVITISDEKAEEIFNKDFNSKWKSASSKYNFPSLEKYPEKLQIAVVDGFFRGDLSSRQRAGQSHARQNIRNAMSAFFKYQEAVKQNRTSDAEKYLKEAKNSLSIAARNYLKHPDYTDLKKDGVDKRMKENAKLISSALDDYNISTNP